MKRIKIGLLSILFIALITSCLTAETKDSPTENQAIYSQMESDSNKSDSIQHILTKVVNDGKAPGMVAASASSKGVIAIASAGERKDSSGIVFTTKDLVHLGSCTKAMTSTMIATLVAEGKLNWESKLIDVIPELKESIHADYYNINLWHLLTHRAGIPKNPKDWDAFGSKEIKERRLALLKDNLKSPATNEIDKFNYSNFGYLIAACMAEKVTGLSWEVLMQKRLFDPLGMSSAGFGAPNTHNQIDQPWGHSNSWLGNSWKPDQTDNPEALGPAGRVHCNIEDWAKFLSLQLTDENPILERKYLNKLIEPDGDYAAGWAVIEQPWTKGVVHTHNGSNGVWYAMVVVAPQLNRTFIVVTNSCNFNSTPGICNEILKKLVRMELNRTNE
jgi:CubicO group peptidase (beta-lactamase class C family)